MLVYPNPSQGNIEIWYPDKKMHYNIYAMNGIKLKSGKLTGNPGFLSFKDFKDGLYLLECFSENKTYLEKILINN